MGKDKTNTTEAKLKKLKEVNERISNASKVADKAECIGETINQTLYAKDGYIVDMKNFSVVSVTQPRDLY